MRTFSGWIYVFFITETFLRRIVSWQTTSLYAALTLHVLKMESDSENEPVLIGRAW